MLKPDVSITYEALGSGSGLAAINNTKSGIDFAGSDSTLKETDYDDVRISFTTLINNASSSILTCKCFRSDCRSRCTKLQHSRTSKK